MPDMLAIVRRAMFEELAGDKQPGDLLSWERYTNDAPRLSQLTRGSRLFLIRVPGGIGERVVRVVSENAHALGLAASNFEKD